MKIKIRVYNITNLHLETRHVDTLEDAKAWLDNYTLVPNKDKLSMYDYALEDTDTVYNVDSSPYNVPAFANICVTC